MDYFAHPPHPKSCTPPLWTFQPAMQQGATHEPPFLRGAGSGRKLFTRKVAALLVVSVGLAAALVVSLPNNWMSAAMAPPTIMWRKPPRTGGGDSGGDTGGGVQPPSLVYPPPPPSSSAEAEAAPSSSSSDSDANPACRFDYPGPLRPESLGCYAEFFPGQQPFAYPPRSTLTPGRRFSLSGVEWEEDGGVPRVPIIVLFKDRVSVLIETLRSFWRHIGTPYEVRGFIFDGMD